MISVLDLQRHELEAGAKLPSTEDLAEQFGVAKGTIGSAIRTLRDEGFITSRAGAPVRVRSQESLPAADHPLAGTAAFLFEMGHLKNLPRAGWLLLGIPQPESVAEHSFRVGMVGMTLAAIAGADIGHTAALALLHDAHETRIGDVPSVGRAYITTAKPEAVTAHQTAGMPDDVGKAFQALTAEYEANEIETLLQAIEYQAQGHDAAAWRDTSLAALRTDEGKQLAQAIGAADPHWWSAFAASYHELRASTRARTEPS